MDARQECVVEPAAGQSMDEAKRDVKNNEINGTEIAANLCDGEYFEHYTDQMRYGCYKLLQEHWNVVIGGMRLGGVRTRHACVSPSHSPSYANRSLPPAALRVQRQVVCPGPRALMERRYLCFLCPLIPALVKHSSSTDDTVINQHL